MSGILAVVGEVSEQRVRDALIPLRYLGGEVEQAWREDDVRLVATRKSWQLDEDFCGDVLVLESEDLVVVADASLFDKPGLARRLSESGAIPHGDTPSHLIAAAYRAWGPEMVHRLNGDYAFAIWDRSQRMLFAARDPIGGRPLYLTRLGAGIAVASSARALAELRNGVQDLNLANLASQVGGLGWSHGLESVFREVVVLRAGRRLAWRNGAAQVETFWEPPLAPERSPVPLAQAAEELRDLLATAASQRMARGQTTVWMSGGWDSTAVFGAGQSVLADGDRGRLRPVSITYPKGDPGHEDGFIREVGARWGVDVHWIQSEELELFAGLEARAAAADQPPVHLYELWNQGLARGTRALGSRVALDGSGGDQLFQVSDIILADLVRTGRLVEAGRFVKARRRWGWKYLVQLGLLPLLPDAGIRLGERVLRRRIPRHYLERPLAGWIRPEFASAHRLRQQELQVLRSARGSSLAHTETLLYVTMPVWAWGGSFMRGALLQEGVEFRSPLLDLQVVRFALGRPVLERANGQETKLLLRRSMEGLLPPGVLAPRAYRTGTTLGLSSRRMLRDYPGMISRLFAAPLILADLGIVDPRQARAAADAFERGACDESTKVNLFHLLKAEFWLRGLRRGGGQEGAGSRPAERVGVSPAA